MQLKTSSIQTHRSIAVDRVTGRTESWRRVQRLLRPPAGFWPALMEANVWIVAAMALRILGEIVLAHLPHLGMVVILLLVAPAAIAIVLSTWAPTLSILLGYRLILIAFGLLLGGNR